MPFGDWMVQIFSPVPSPLFPDFVDCKFPRSGAMWLKIWGTGEVQIERIHLQVFLFFCYLLYLLYSLSNFPLLYHSSLLLYTHLLNTHTYTPTLIELASPGSHSQWASL